MGHVGFNASSQLSISRVGDGAIITNAALNTLLGASAGGLTALLIHRFIPYWPNFWSYITMVNGALSGMVMYASQKTIQCKSSTRKSFIKSMMYVLIP